MGPVCTRNPSHQRVHSLVQPVRGAHEHGAVVGRGHSVVGVVVAGPAGQGDCKVLMRVQALLEVALPRQRAQEQPRSLFSSGIID